MSPDDLLDQLTGICHRTLAPDSDVSLPPCRWWHLAALEAWEQRRLQLIMSRDGTELYLARFWLHQPKALIRDDPIADASPWDSGDAMLLHYFARGDDDQALHDHPWDYFSSHILSGGYSERRPPLAWRTSNETWAELGSVPGCAWSDHEITVRDHDSGEMMRIGRNQHAVEDVLPETWSLIQTGPRVRPWGFHRPGGIWQPYREFLAEKRATVAQAGGAA